MAHTWRCSGKWGCGCTGNLSHWKWCSYCKRFDTRKDPEVQPCAHPQPGGAWTPEAAAARAGRAASSTPPSAQGETRRTRKKRGQGSRDSGEDGKGEGSDGGLRNLVAALAADVRQLLGASGPAPTRHLEDRPAPDPAAQAEAAPPAAADAGQGQAPKEEEAPNTSKVQDPAQTPEKLRERGKLLRAAAAAVAGPLRDQLLREADALQAEERALRPTGERLRAVHRAVGDHEAKVANLVQKLVELQRADTKLDADLEAQLAAARVRFADAKMALQKEADRVRGQLDVRRSKLADVKRTAAALAGADFAAEAGAAQGTAPEAAGAAPRWGAHLLVDPATLSDSDRRELAAFLLAPRAAHAPGEGMQERAQPERRSPARAAPPSVRRTSGRRGTSPARSEESEQEDTRSRSDRRGPPSECGTTAMDAVDCSQSDDALRGFAGPPAGDVYPHVAPATPAGG